MPLGGYAPRPQEGAGRGLSLLMGGGTLGEENSLYSEKDGLQLDILRKHLKPRG